MKAVNIYIYTEYKGTFAKGSGSYHVLLEMEILDINGDIKTYTWPPEDREPLIKTFEEITKNRLALMALEEGLSHIKEPCNIIIYIDSDYVYSTFNNGWLDKWRNNGFVSGNKPVKNADIWEHVSEISVQHSITVIKTDKTTYTNWQANEIKRHKESIK